MIEINKFVRNEEVLSKRGGFAGGYRYTVAMVFCRLFLFPMVFVSCAIFASSGARVFGV